MPAPPERAVERGAVPAARAERRPALARRRVLRRLAAAIRRRWPDRRLRRAAVLSEAAVRGGFGALRKRDAGR